MTSDDGFDRGGARLTERLSERLLSRQTLGIKVHAEPRSTRRKSNLPPPALSAPPREKKSVGAVVVAGTGKAEGQWPEGKASSSSVAGGADPGAARCDK